MIYKVINKQSSQ